MMDYTLLKKQENELYNTNRNFFSYKYSCIGLILFCIAADGFTLYKLIDLFLEQGWFMTFIITITVAGVLNLAAYLLAYCLHNKEFKPREQKTLACLILTVFFLFFFAVFALRIASMEQLYVTEEDSSGQDSASGSIDEKENFTPTTGQIILAVILGLEPLGTSVLCFYISYENSPAREQRHLRVIHAIELEEEIDRDKLMIAELESNQCFDLESYDNNQHSANASVIQQKGEIAKNTSIRKLSEHDSTAAGVTYLMEGAYLMPTQEEAPNHPSSTEEQLRSLVKAHFRNLPEDQLRQLMEEQLHNFTEEQLHMLMEAQLLNLPDEQLPDLISVLLQQNQKV